MEAGAALLAAGMPVPTVYIPQAVSRAVTSAVAAMSEISRIFLSCAQDAACAASSMVCTQYFLKCAAPLCSAAQVQRQRDAAVL
jgi:hypothetical protein